MPYTPGDPIDEGPGPAPGGLGERLVNGAVNLFARAYNAVRDSFGRAVDNTVKRWVQEAEDKLNSQVDGLVNKVEAAAAAPTFGAAIRAMLDPLPLIAIAGGLVAFVGAAVSGAASRLVAFALHRATAEAEFQANRAFPAERLGAGTGRLAERRDALSLAQLTEDLRDQGWSDERITAQIAAAGRWLTVGEIEDAYHRGNLSEPQAREQLRGLGITDEQVQTLFANFERIPPATDLVRFVVREVYDPGLRAEQLEGVGAFPQFLADMRRQGFNDFDAASYWAAHWDLPSTSQGYEMFHRLRPGASDTPFTLDDLRALLRRNDVLPQFIEQLIAIARPPITRIDLRRLYTSGVYARDQVYEGYLDLGYSPEHAEALTAFATRSGRTADRDLTQAQIVAAYKRRLLPRDAALAALLELRYEDDEAALFLAQADYDLVQQRAGRRTTVIRSRYLAGLLTEAEAVNQLSALGKDADEVEELVTLWIEQRQDRTERPSVSQLIAMYADRVIAGPDLLAELRLAGYDDKYANWFLAEADTKIAEEEARKSLAESRRAMVRLPIPTRGDLADWLRKGIITVDDFTARLLAQGYTADAVAAYATSVRLPVAIPFYGSPEGRIRATDAKEEFRRAIIDGAELRRRLQALGYPIELADAIADYEELKLGP